MAHVVGRNETKKRASALTVLAVEIALTPYKCPRIVSWKRRARSAYRTNCFFVRSIAAIENGVSERA